MRGLAVPKEEGLTKVGHYTSSAAKLFPVSYRTALTKEFIALKIATTL
jgi:hypothetical protein